MKKIYIAGPMSGYENLNFPAFHAAAARLRSQGRTVVNPAEINGGTDELVACAQMTPAELIAHYRKCMENDIRHLIECDGIYMLSGWARSKGATLEHQIAVTLGLSIEYAPC